MALRKHIVTLTFEDETVKSWPDSYLKHEGGGGRSGDQQSLRVVVHEGNFIRASFRSDLVRSAVVEEQS